MTTKVIGLGAGGHAQVIIDILRSHTSYELVGLLDPNPELQGKKVLEVPVIGNDNLLSTLKDKGISHFFVGLGGAGNTKPRQNLYNFALQHTMIPINVIHPQAMVSSSAKLGMGVTLMAGTIINACARLGINVIVNTGAIVEHDCIIADHVHIATGATLAGAVQIETGVHIGAGATVKQGIHIGEYAIIGAGAVVVKNVLPRTTVVGVPAHILK